MRKVRLHSSVTREKQTHVRRTDMKSRIASIVITGLAAIAVAGIGIMPDTASTAHAGVSSIPAVNLMAVPLPWDTQEATLELERMGFFDTQEDAASIYRPAMERVHLFPGWDATDARVEIAEGPASDYMDAYREKLGTVNMFPGWDDSDARVEVSRLEYMDILREKISSGIHPFKASYDDSEVAR